MTDLPDTYDPGRIERTWREAWADSDVYAAGEDPDYVIDTPPPYPTGDLHVGHALGWSYMDFAARYRRMCGDDVLFPQGWDCHGLPTEVKVEEREGIHRTDVPREEFRRLCIEHTEGRIDAMRETMARLGFSQDWDAEYETMDPDYWGKTQRSFVDLVEADYVYRDEHPVNWCPRCETAIADAEVDAIDREATLHYITFPAAVTDESEDEGAADESPADETPDVEVPDPLEIATSRPELLAACVAIAVHPDDERHADRVGTAYEVPLFGQTVEVVADEMVDPEFGTGAVMVCTFGDKQDVDWWTRFDLELRHAVTADGRLGEVAGEYAGLDLESAAAEIAADLEAAELLVRTEPTDQTVGVCWRCETTIEIRSTEQWFVEVRDEEILTHAREVEWIPEHMYDRLAAWTEGMDWDWVISRQRVFATPIPAWYCEACGATHVADRAELPVEPTEADPAVGDCPECGASDWTAETDVMDTWMDSSISAMHVAGWPDEPFEPVALREQGHDIIRTWAFYTLLRTAALADATPWETALVNGMVFGEDGRKMSKSRENVVSPEAAIEEAGADAFRQALALGGQPGNDVQFRWKEITAARRFLTKSWNVVRFGTEHFDESTPEMRDPAWRDADAWIVARTAEVAESVGEAMDDYRFDRALRELREFVWHDLADDYLELVKGRLYEGRPGERDAARHALYTAVSATLRLLAPFSPFFAEECWNALVGTEGSVHAAAWPGAEADDGAGLLDRPDHEAAARGDLIAEVAAAVRGWKSEHGLALNAPLDRVEVYPDAVEGPVDTYDLADAVNGPVYVESGRPRVETVPVGVDPDWGVLGPRFRGDAEAVVRAAEARDPADVARELREDGAVTVEVDGEERVVDADALDVVEAHRAPGGEPVEVVETERSTVLVVVPDAGDGDADDVGDVEAEADSEGDLEEAAEPEAGIDATDCAGADEPEAGDGTETVDDAAEDADDEAIEVDP